jgi:plasmid segregation protein ParM
MSVKQPMTASTQLPIVSIDLGRTYTKTCTNRDPNNVVLIPANVAHLESHQVPKGEFESQTTAPLLAIWLEYQGRQYAFGQLAADFGANLGMGQSKIEDALVKIFACIGYFNLRNNLAIVLSLPYYSQEQFDREKEQLVRLLKAPHVVSYRGDRIPVQIQQVWVMPEGYGSLIWCEAQNRETANLGFAEKSVAIIDVGYQTTDLLMVDRFRFARGVSKSESFAMNQFYEQVAAKIPGADSQSLTLIEAINHPEGQRFFRPRGAKSPIDLDDFLLSLRKGFTDELSERIFNWLPERTTDVIVSGGGGEFLWADLQPRLREAQLGTHLAKPSRVANALGQYVYGEAQQLAATRLSVH